MIQKVIKYKEKTYKYTYNPVRKTNRKSVVYLNKKQMEDIALAVIVRDYPKILLAKVCKIGTKRIRDIVNNYKETYPEEEEEYPIRTDNLQRTVAYLHSYCDLSVRKICIMTGQSRYIINKILRDEFGEKPETEYNIEAIRRKLNV